MRAKNIVPIGKYVRDIKINKHINMDPFKKVNKTTYNTVHIIWFIDSDSATSIKETVSV